MKLAWICIPSETSSHYQTSILVLLKCRDTGVCLSRV
ncbi:hypothetical protein F383_20737 [Gossypium arboreum]|uniref:Uncharacterized protein n=1 Tax=Gossypium arboreum TaxID=29729 RepID=A0A0B0NZR2_GOSAR|nr:hypothetical protein F383_20737 [Gossypium arboreum]